MTDPAFAIKQKVENLLALQIDTLRKLSSLTAAELDEYHSRSAKIAGLRDSRNQSLYRFVL